MRFALFPSQVMRALRTPDDPYPLHGSEVAIRYCSPTNGASRVSPSTFATYLAEPHYQILTGMRQPSPLPCRTDLSTRLLSHLHALLLTEWDEMEIEEDGECSLETNACDVDVLVKREGDSSPTVVNWVLSRHNGRWLTDSLTIN